MLAPHYHKNSPLCLKPFSTGKSIGETRQKIFLGYLKKMMLKKIKKTDATKCAGCREKIGVIRSYQTLLYGHARFQFRMVSGRAN